MHSKSALLLVSVLLEVLRSVHCRTVGEVCNRSIPSECDPGLICAADNTSPDITYCQSSPCNLDDCPSLWCGVDLQYTPEGQCCPACPHLPTALVVACTEPNGDRYNEGESWQRDLCTSCTCTNGHPLCSAISCAPPSCTNYVQLADRCCPTCIETAVALPPVPRDDCEVGGIVYSNGEVWTPDRMRPCRRALCDEGEVLYFSHQCGAPECKSPIFSDDTCCPTCLEEELTPITPPLVSLPSRLECSYNGITLQEGETHCPAPNTTITCHSGELEYSSHCDPVPCSNPIAGISPCDCPYCPVNLRDFVVGGLLNMPIYRFAFRASQIDDMLDSFVLEAGLTPDYNLFSPCNRKICLELHVFTSDSRATEDDVVADVRKVVAKKHQKELSIGNVKDFPKTGRRRSIRSLDYMRSQDTQPLTHSSSSDQHDSATATATAVIACVGGVIACVVGVALLASFVRRKKNSRKTVTV